MTRKFFSALFLIDSLIVGLGAFPHGLQWSSHVSGMLGGIDPHTVSLLEVIWLWVSGTLLASCALLIWCWSRLRRGDASLAPVAWVTGGFYLLAGSWAALTAGPFFWLFTVLGGLLWLCTWMLRPAKA